MPSFEVSDIDAFMKKLEELGAPIVFPCVQILDNWVLEFKDTEGNVLKANKSRASKLSGKQHITMCLQYPPT